MIPNDTKEFIDKAIEFLEEFPEVYRTQILGFILRNYEREIMEEKISEQQKDDTQKSRELILPREIRAFLQKTNIPVDELFRLFLIDDEGVTVSYTLTTQNRTARDIQLDLSCLLALEEAIVSGAFQFSKDELRTRFDRLGFYISADFLKNMRNRSEYYIDIEPDIVEISDTGLNHIATVIRERVE